MDILFIIYIFALFVIFSPNFIFQYSKSNNLLVAILHAIIFSIVVYVTYNSVTKTQTEGATIGTYDKNDEISALNVNELNLGGVLNDPSDDKKPKDVQYRNEIVVSSPNTAEEEKIIAMPPYDYSNFRTYDYENMEKKLKMLESHKHTNHYFDLVPNFNETKHEILCAADHDTNKPCCRQPDAVIPESNQCDALKPYCKDYISGTQWGKCVTTNPYPKPNLGYNGQFVSISPEETPIAVVKKPDGTVIIQECPVQSPAPALAPALAPPPAPCVSSSFMVAVGKGTNSIAWSEDGKSWSPVNNSTTIFSDQGGGVAWNGSMWVAVGKGTNSIAWSEDGKNWTGLGSSIFDNGVGVACNGSIWVAVGGSYPNISNTIAWSEDGKNWTGLGSSIFDNGGLGVAWNGSIWVAVGTGSNRIAWSEDGKNWTKVTDSSNVFGTASGVAWNGSMWVAVGGSYNDNTVAWSEDGKIWNKPNNALIQYGAKGVAWNGSLWVMVGNGGGTGQGVQWSEDGQNWDYASGSDFALGNGVAWNGTIWVAVSTAASYPPDTPQGTISWSGDGKSWPSLGRDIFSIAGYGIASKNVLPYTDKWANCQ